MGVVNGAARSDTDDRLPHGRKPGTIETYASEWRRYLAFARSTLGSDLIPGKDVPWNPYLLWRYLLMRSETCKPSSIFSGISGLTHFGHRHRFLLPSNKWDGCPLLRRDIDSMKNEITLLFNAKGAGVTGVKRSTPLCFRSVGFLLSAYQVWNEEYFNSLDRRNRHHVANCVMQHTKAMRFGHFLHRRYTTHSFSRDVYACRRLYTDWHRYSGRRRYCLEFSRSPAWACLRYTVRCLDDSVACPRQTSSSHSCSRSCLVC